MSKQKLTKWFTNGEKPWEPGVYQQRSGVKKALGYQKWDGKSWYRWCKTANEAAKEAGVVSILYANDPWRGLARPPKAKP